MTHLCVCGCVCMHVHVGRAWCRYYIYMYIYILYICVCIYIYIHTHIYIHVCVRVCHLFWMTWYFSQINTPHDHKNKTCAHMHILQMYMYIRICIHAPHTYIHTYIHTIHVTSMERYILQMCMYTRIYIHTDMWHTVDVYAYTYIHTYIWQASNDTESLQLVPHLFSKIDTPQDYNFKQTSYYVVARTGMGFCVYPNVNVFKFELECR